MWYLICNRRRFRSQTSDNMDRWKAEMGRVREEKRREEKRREEKRREEKRREEEEKKKEDQKEKRREEERRSKRESLRRKKFQVREKVGKSRHAVFFQWFVAPAGRKVGSLKRRVRSHVARWLMKTRTPFVARSTFASEKAKSTSRSEHFWKLRCRKSARRCGAKHMSKSKCTKHTIVGPLLEVETSKKCTPLWREAHFEVKMYKTFGPLLEVVMSKKCTPLWREAHFEVKSAKNWGVRSTFGRSDAVLRGRRDCAPCQKSKVSKTWRFCGISRNHGKRGTFEEDLQRCIFRGRHSTRDMFIRALISWDGLHFGASDLQVCWDDFAWQLQHFVWPGITFSWQAQYFRRWSGKIAKRIGTRSSALHSTFHFWRKSRRIASFLLLSLSTSKIEEVWQNCFVFDAAKFKNWGSLAQVLRFQACR